MEFTELATAGFGSMLVIRISTTAQDMVVQQGTFHAPAVTNHANEMSIGFEFRLIAF